MARRRKMGHAASTGRRMMTCSRRCSGRAYPGMTVISPNIIESATQGHCRKCPTASGCGTIAPSPILTNSAHAHENPLLRRAGRRRHHACRLRRHATRAARNARHAPGAGTIATSTRPVRRRPLRRSGAPGGEVGRAGRLHPGGARRGLQAPGLQLLRHALHPAVRGQLRPHPGPGPSFELAPNEAGHPAWGPAFQRAREQAGR